MNTDESNKVLRWSALPPPAGHADTPQLSIGVEVEFGARSQKGLQQSSNDDHYLILRLGRHQETLMTSLPEDEVQPRFDESAYGMVVADGMGRAGEIASRLAISTLAHLALYFGKWNVRIDDAVAEEVMDRAEQFYRAVDATLVQAGSYRPLGLQTTLTAVYTAGHELFVAHVGHSRAYLYRDDELLPLTHDHTLASDRQGSSAIVGASASPEDLHHTVTGTIGRDSAGPRIDVERCGLLDGDMVLLCTNGLTDALDEAAIAGVLREPGTADDCCGHLVALAAAAGAEDDTTALLARYRLLE